MSLARSSLARRAAASDYQVALQRAAELLRQHADATTAADAAPAAAPAAHAEAAAAGPAAPSTPRMPASTATPARDPYGFAANGVTAAVQDAAALVAKPSASVAAESPSTRLNGDGRAQEASTSTHQPLASGQAPAEASQHATQHTSTGIAAESAWQDAGASPSAAAPESPGHALPAGSPAAVGQASAAASAAEEPSASTTTASHRDAATASSSSDLAPHAAPATAPLAAEVHSCQTHEPGLSPLVEAESAAPPPPASPLRKLRERRCGRWAPHGLCAVRGH
jgi:hypothetical protein